MRGGWSGRSERDRTDGRSGAVVMFLAEVVLADFLVCFFSVVVVVMLLFFGFS